MSDGLVRVVTKFLENKKFIGVCGCKVIPNKKGDNLPKVIIKINVDFIYGSHTNELFLIKRIMLGVHKELKNIFDLDFPIDYELHEC